MPVFTQPFFYSIFYFFLYLSIKSCTSTPFLYGTQYTHSYIFLQKHLVKITKDRKCYVFVPRLKFCNKLFPSIEFQNLDSYQNMSNTYHKYIYCRCKNIFSVAQFLNAFQLWSQLDRFHVTAFFWFHDLSIVKCFMKLLKRRVSEILMFEKRVFSTWSFPAYIINCALINW